jgi:1-hydroxycarotenoid 3,4-desaturase
MLSSNAPGVSVVVLIESTLRQTAGVLQSTARCALHLPPPVGSIIAVRNHRVIVVGAGAGGLAAAIDLARRGLDVTVCESAPSVGGKLRHVDVGNVGIDAGPTVFTMRWILEGLFADAGRSLESSLRLQRAGLLARHAWRDGGTLDLFADMGRSADAIRRFAGDADAQGYLDFCERSAAIYRTLQHSFIAAQRPSPIDLVRRIGLRHADDLFRITPFDTLWRALGKHFHDPRLRQLFGRYATYCGSSPFRAPATLMLVAHVEQDGVWLVDGGMRAVALALAGLATDLGARIRCSARVAQILVANGRAAGVRLDSGEELRADSVVFNGDVSALADGLLGDSARGAADPTPPAARSLSAVTWCLHAATRGFDLAHHNVFFAGDYGREFSAIFERGDITDQPTVYVCAQDRADGAAAPAGAERLLLLINAPANGDDADWGAARVAVLHERTDAMLRGCGLEIDWQPDNNVATTPQGFARLFPGSGGALYGRASDGAMATFRRAAAASRLPGLYLAGGSVHPGPGVPMAVMSGRLAAQRLAQTLG